MTAIMLRQVSRRYGDRLVLGPLDLTIRFGEALVVQGPNGSGKTTLLQMIAGLSRPTSGSVSGIPRRVGYLPELFLPPRSMRADAYLRNVGRMGGLSTGAARERAEFLAHALAIRPGLNERLGRLSKGNLQKIGLAQMFLHEPLLLVLDEPRTGLEPAVWAALDDLIDSAVGRGAAVVSSEHDATVVGAAPRLLRMAADGTTVLERASQRDRVEVVVESVGGTASGLSTLLSLVSSATAESPEAIAGHAVIRVDASEKDTVLRWLLANGWTVNRLSTGGGGD